MASVEELLAEHQQSKASGECKNGMSLSGLAQSAWNVHASCYGIAPCSLDHCVVKELWIKATTDLARHIEEEKLKDDGMVHYMNRAKAFWDTVFSDKEPDATNLLISECVVRHVCNCVMADVGHLPNVPQLEKSMPALMKQLQEKRDPGKKERKPVAVTNGVHKEPLPPVVQSSVIAGPTTVYVTQPQQQHGALGGFREVIQLKIAEYNRKITLLHNLDQKIGPECDEALWEVFKDVFNPKEK